MAKRFTYPEDNKLPGALDPVSDADNQNLTEILMNTIMSQAKPAPMSWTEEKWRLPVAGETPE
jgi:hypothetical protein